jgi:hypothetical protein
LTSAARRAIMFLSVREQRLGGANKMAKQLTGKFQVGTVNDVKVDKEFPYDFRQFDSYEEVLTSADWTPANLLTLVNSHEKASAKANEYQKVTAPYRPDPNDPAQKREMLIRNLVNTFNVPRDIAEQQIDALIAAGATK